MKEKSVIELNLWLVVFIQVASIASYSPFVPQMKGELHFSFGEFGLLSTVFYLPYAMMQVFAGRASDRGRARILLVLGIPVLLASTMALALISNLAEALALRAFAGIFGAMIFVPSVRIITRLDPGGLNNAIALLGTSVAAGSLYVSLVGSEFSLLFGWRLGLALMMLPGFSVWIANLRYLREPKAISPRITDDKSFFPLWTLKRKETWLLGYQQFVRIGLWLSLSIWLPTYFSTYLGYGIVGGGLSLTVFSIFAFFSCLLGGQLATRWRSSSGVSSFSFLGLGVVLAVVPLTYSIPLAWSLAGAFGLFVFMSFGPLFAILPTLFNQEVAGFVTGFQTMLANVGAIVVPFLFGFLVDLTGNFDTSWIVLAGMCVLAFLLGIPVISVEHSLMRKTPYQ